MAVTTKLSIIIPTYNCIQYLEPLLDILYKQLNKYVEVIIIDDGSTDNTKDKLQEWASHQAFTEDKRFIVSLKINGGVSSARNKGLELAKGQYIAFIDADDEISDNYIEVILKEIKSKKDVYKIGWESFGAYCNFRYKGSELPIWNVSVWSRIMKRKYTKIKFNEEKKTAEDSQFLVENLNFEVDYGYIDDIIYKYRTGRADSLMSLYGGL